jgi:hypothetical protein
LVCIGLFALTLLSFPWLDESKYTSPGVVSTLFPEDEKTAIEKAAESIGSAIRDAKQDRELRITKYSFFLNPPSKSARPDWSMACVRWVPLFVFHAGFLVPSQTTTQTIKLSHLLKVCGQSSQPTRAATKVKNREMRARSLIPQPVKTFLFIVGSLRAEA